MMSDFICSFGKMSTAPKVDQLATRRTTNVDTNRVKHKEK